MFYRFGEKDIRMAIDLDNLFRGSVAFLAGGAPSLVEFASINKSESVCAPIMSINNAATIVRSDMWVGGDKPVCYSESVSYTHLRAHET